MKSFGFNNPVLRQWNFEILVAATAIGVLVALSIVLFNFDAKPIFDGPVLTLNAIVSTLSTTNRVCLLTILASTISQWNWLLFSDTPRRLLDFEYVSAASRGPLGSLKVLLNSRIFGGVILRIGALVTVLTIALDPFAQQLVQLKNEMKAAEPGSGVQASISKVDYYTGAGSTMIAAWPDDLVVKDGRMSGSQVARVYFNHDMEFALMVKFAGPMAGFTQQPNFNCSSAKCGFKTFKSLAVCSKCENITSSIKERKRYGRPFAPARNPESNSNEEMTEYFLPNGLYLSNFNRDNPIIDRKIPKDLYMTMFGTGDPKRTVAMKSVDTLVWAQSFIKVNDSDLFRAWPPVFNVSAEECALYYCIKEFNASVENGTLQETSVELKTHRRIPSSWQITSKRAKKYKLPDWTQDYLAFDPILSAFPRSALRLGDPKSSESWAASQVGVNSNSILFKRLFTTCIRGRDNCTADNEDRSWDAPNGYLTGTFDDQYEPKSAYKLGLSTNLSSIFENLAFSMTTAMRNAADGTDPDKILANYTYTANHAETLNHTVTKGTVLVPITVYSITWPWITLHCVATLGCLVFLILTISSTSKAEIPAWKPSELAIFSQTAGTKKVFTGHETHSELEEKARKASVILLGKQDIDSELEREEEIMLR
ncbi:hypothetical protein F53441_4120 [Fusarium austroafricanum]|uniref:Uncharacterized protein n=1 Tax=Fusarium austroafricanum TaxID=2364996 RepID=A0A8H4P104_9HYPO|nr:hypothetical protein F53441_4120 [Fusarium austroafricanum]